jgi:hypothetical protein
MPAAYSDLYLEQGTTFVTSVTLDGNNGEPYNLNYFTVRSQARRSYYSSNATLTFTSTITDAANGVIQLSATPSVTANVPAGKLVYDVLLTDSNSETVTRVLEGQIFVSPSVTR